MLPPTFRGSPLMRWSKPRVADQGCWPSRRLSALLPVMLAVGSTIPGMNMPQYALALCLTLGIMGILKSGATFTVVDPAYPVQRQVIYLKVAQPRAERSHLSLPDGGQRDVRAALVATLAVPRGLTVTDEQDVHARTLHSIPEQTSW